MRVALVSIGDPRDIKVWSGIPYSVMKELEQQAASIEVIAPLSRWFKYLYAPWRYLSRARGHSYQFDRHPFALKSFARQIEKQMRGKSFDIVISTSSVAISALKTNVPVIYWTDAVLEGMIGYYPAFGTFTAHELAIGHRQEQAAIDRATRAVYASHWAMRTVLQSYERTDGKLSMMHFGANLTITHGQSDVHQMIEARLKQPVNLLFIGVDWERKGGALAWEATRQLNEQGIPAVLRVAGCEAPPAPFVKNLGFINKSTPEGQQRFKELMSEATIFLFPTRAEAAGCVFAEASAFGLPILSTDTGGVRDYVVSGVNGFTFPLDANADKYAAAIRKLMEDPMLYRELSQGGFERYMNHLNWAAGIRSLLQTVTGEDTTR